MAAPVRYLRGVTMNRPAFRIILLSIALVAIVAVFYTLKMERAVPGEARSFLPSQAEAIIRIDRYQASMDRLRKSSFKEWPSDGPAAALRSLIAKLDSLHAYSSQWNELLGQASCWMIMPSLVRPDEWALVHPFTEDQVPQADELMASWSSSAAAATDFRGGTLSSRGEWHYGIWNNCLVWGSTRSAVEGAVIASSDSDRAEWLADCERVSSADAPVHLYLKTDVIRWSLDLPYRPGQGWISGYSFRDTLAMPLSAEGAFGVDQILPSTATYLECWSYPGGADAWQAAGEVQSESANTYWSKAWRDQGDSCQCDLQETMLSWRSGEWGHAVLSSSHTAPVRFIGVADSLDAIRLLKPLLGDSVPGGNRIIYSIRYPEPFRRNAVGLLVEPLFLTQYAGYIWIASDENALEALGAPPLHQSAAYARMKEVLQPKGGRWVYTTGAATGAIPPQVAAWAGPGSPMAMHTVEAERGHQHILMSPGGRARVEGSTAQEALESDGWQVELPADPTNRTWLLRNHHTGHRELLVQDAGHVLHLLSASGELLWSRPVDGPVTGDVVQVDALRNGKLQMAFHTTTKLYLMDRNGQGVEGFPVALPSPASCPMYVADYDGDRNYRFLVGCEDGMLRNYSVQGVATKGWKPYQGEGPVRFVHHFRQGNEDILVCWPEGQRPALLKRSGEFRSYPAGDYSHALPGSEHLSRGIDLSSSALTFIRESGELVRIAFGSGKVQVIAGGLSTDARFASVDVNMDNKADYALAHDSEFRIYDSSGEEVMSLRLSSGLNGTPRWFPTGTGGGYFALTLSNGSVHMMGLDGKDARGFPVAGCRAGIIADFMDGTGAHAIALCGRQVRLLY